MEYKSLMVEADGPFLTVGRLAKKAGVNLQTVLYYERRRILLPARRTESGYRLYGPDAWRVLHFIKEAQQLGFALEEIGRLLRLRVRRRAQCVQVKRQAQARLAVVQEKLSTLGAMERSLRRLIRNCSANTLTDRCPVLEGLEFGSAARPSAS